MQILHKPYLYFVRVIKTFVFREKIMSHDVHWSQQGAEMLGTKQRCTVECVPEANRKVLRKFDKSIAMLHNGQSPFDRS